MVATVQIGEKNSSSGAFTDKTSGTVRFKNADDATVNTANPMVIPAGSSVSPDVSYEKWTRLKVTVAPDTNISNLQFYTDGTNSFGTGVEMFAKASTQYPSSTGPNESPGSSDGYADAFTYSSTNTLALGTGTFTGTGEKGSHAVFIMEVSSSATQGTLTGETGTWQYDEI